MNPQGSQIVNLEYYTQLTASVNAASSCAQLQALYSEAMASVTATQGAINSELALVMPLLALLESPATNPGAIVSWITSFITLFLTPMVKPSITYVDQLAAITEQITALASAVNSASSKFPDCTIV